MKISSMIQYNTDKKNKPKFGGFSELMMSNVFLNKTLFDLAGSDIPWVVMANNNSERRERVNRAALSVGMIFIAPLLALPFANRFAMKYIARLTPKLFSENYNAIRLSNSCLKSLPETKKGLHELADTPIVSSIPKLLNIKGLKQKPQRIDVDNLLEMVEGSSKNKKINTLDEKYEEIRKRIIKAKNFVMGVDSLIIAGSFGQIGFYNNHMTEKKTGQIGYSAELKMADKDTVEKRAAKFKKSEKQRYLVYLSSLAALAVGVPLFVKHGMVSKGQNGISGFIKKHCEQFDYNDAIFTNRLPLALSLTCANFGIFMASRNNTERKDNAIRSSSGLSIFFLGDLLLTSIGGRISDNLFKTKILKHSKDDGIFKKILPPTKSIEELKETKCPKTMRNAKIAFWTNFAILAFSMGIATPYFINKLIKKEVAEDANK